MVKGISKGRDLGVRIGLEMGMGIMKSHGDRDIQLQPNLINGHGDEFAHDFDHEDWHGESHGDVHGDRRGDDHGEGHGKGNGGCLKGMNNVCQGHRAEAVKAMFISCISEI